VELSTHEDETLTSGRYDSKQEDKKRGETKKEIISQMREINTGQRNEWEDELHKAIYEYNDQVKRTTKTQPVKRLKLSSKFKK